MASNMANLLMQYGAELPNIIKSNRKTANDLETEKLRQAILQGQITESQLGSAFKQKQIDAADIANQSAVEEDQRKRQAREAMASALGSYASSKRTTGMAQDIAGMEQAAGLTPLASEKGFDKPMSMREAAESAGLPQYAEQEGVKQFYAQNISDVGSDKKENTPFNLVGARIKYDTPEYRSVINSEIDKELSNGEITPEQAQFAKGQVENGFAYDYGQAFRENGVVAALKRGVKIADEYALAAPKANTAASVESAKGSAEAHTPQFIATRKNEWDKSLKDYNEAYQQYTLGAKAKDDAAGDVALINALEKVREINSAVMYGDYEKWNKATNFWESMVENGIVDAAGKKLTNRLPPQTKESLQLMLNDLFANRQDMIETAREQNIDNAISNYGWDFKKANQIYRKPTLGTEKGIKPTVPKDLKTPTGQTVTTIKSDEEYNKLPSGSVFIGPDGKKRTKP